MDNRCQHNEFTGILWAQLATDRLFDLYRQAPGSDEFRSDFCEVTADIRLLHFSQRRLQIPRFNERRLGPLWNGLVQDTVADIA